MIRWDMSSWFQRQLNFLVNIEQRILLVEHVFRAQTLITDITFAAHIFFFGQTNSIFHEFAELNMTLESFHEDLILEIQK